MWGKQLEYGIGDTRLGINVYHVFYFKFIIKLPRIFLIIFPFVDPEVHPQHEEYWGHVNSIGPRACYDEGKRVAETMCYAYHKQVFCISRVEYDPISL